MRLSNRLGTDLQTELLRIREDEVNCNNWLTEDLECNIMPISTTSIQLTVNLHHLHWTITGTNLFHYYNQPQQNLTRRLKWYVNVTFKFIFLNQHKFEKMRQKIVRNTGRKMPINFQTLRYVLNDTYKLHLRASIARERSVRLD